MTEGGEGQQPKPEEMAKQEPVMKAAPDTFLPAKYLDRRSRAGKPGHLPTGDVVHIEASQNKEPFPKLRVTSVEQPDQAEKPLRMPIESVQTHEGLSVNLAPYVLGELAHKEDDQGKLEDRDRRGALHSPAANLYYDFYDVGVGLYNAAAEKFQAEPEKYRNGVDRQELMDAVDDVRIAAAAYALLAYDKFTPDLDQVQAISLLWPVLREQSTVHPEPHSIAAPGLKLSQRQADLLALVAPRVSIDYDKSQTFVSGKLAFAAWGRGNWEPEGWS